MSKPFAVRCLTALNETQIVPPSSLSARLSWQAAFDAPTNSQIEQERWVLAMCEGRRDGRFAEIGAFDGVHLSNTYRLETDHGWSGVLVEPNPALFAALSRSRTAIGVEKAVYRESGQLLSFVASQEIGTLAEYAEADGYAEHRRQAISAGGLITVSTITFDELALIGDIPQRGFDYVSLDTEGSELDILRTIALDRHRIALFTIEHNFVEPRREEMRTLLSEAGYQRLNVGFDDWYWHEGHLAARNGGTLPDIAAINAHVKSIYLD
ncbi:FkbM family methyltransferase [Bosea lathyri]|uniref:Methyltransferase, FkbM family n=1 Tax=Bosea lathyri TaxID=1036778 RepID=A0A1H6BJE1_9HYPH|nr:FkbM family methyltransferase [Bosea lathyri]SEG60515.1 methyltransferase, FkbM family [Bosea lathyri]